MEISIPIKGEPGPRFFNDLEQLGKWIEDESQFWHWLEKFQGHLQLSSLWQQPNKNWNKARLHIREYPNEPDSSSKDRRLKELTNILSHIYDQDQAIPSTSARAQFVEQLRSRSSEEAAYALFTFLKPNEVPAVFAVGTRGIIQAHLFDLGLSHEAATSEKEALNVVSGNWSTFLNNAEAEHSDLSKKRAQTIEDIGNFLKGETAACDKLRLDADNNFKDLEKVFKEKLSLLAPVTYWTDKAKKHLHVSIGLAITFVLLGCGLATLVWMALQHFVIGQSPIPPGTTTSTSGPVPITPEYWRYSIPVATATLLIWPMRIIARMLFSNLHLREDAMERVTMANTYLSFSQSKEGLKEDDRKLILEMLFRPASTGIVHDDASPPSMLNYLSKIGSGQK